MKTTLDLDDDLLIEAKTTAVRRRTTLKAIVEHALRRELQPFAETERFENDHYEIGPFGILSLKKRGKPLTNDAIQHLIDSQHETEDAKAVAIVGKQMS